MRSAGPSPAPAGPPDTSYLTSVLSWVLTRWGHPCDRGWVAEDPALRRFGFSRHATSGGAALVAAAYEGAEPLSRHHLLRPLNVCTREHGIRVLPRGQDDRGHALTSLVTVPA